MTQAAYDDAFKAACAVKAEADRLAYARFSARERAARATHGDGSPEYRATVKAFCNEKDAAYQTNEDDYRAAVRAAWTLHMLPLLDGAS